MVTQSIHVFWESQTDNQHYVRQEWPIRQGFKPDSHNVQSHSLVLLNKILLPLWHIKVGVMKNFVNAMDREGNGVAFLQERFLWICIEKIKVGIFDIPQKRELIKDPLFDEALSEAELSAWQSLKSVVTNFMGNYRSVEYEKGMEELPNSFCQLGKRMSVKPQIWTIFQRTVDTWLKSKVSALTKTFTLWKNATKAGGM